ncbi:hypothetical protein ACFOZY_06370 [Chungangia koreensis]|uniref:Voltage-dependent anion channel n=1 Tax=Chungangia koreensis TaxID=752657 RepID=A0ABV8X3H8_9LACT
MSVVIEKVCMTAMKLHSQRTIDPAAGSIIMAIGIFLLGAIHQFPFLDLHVGFTFSAITVLLWVIFFFLFIRSTLTKTYRQSLANSYISSFGLGTWIAATSVIGDLIVQRAPQYLSFVEVLAIGNVILWIIFMAFSIRQFAMIFRERKFTETHGVILLSTVSTQSIVTLLLNLNPDFEPAVIMALISIGLLLYGLSFILLMIRFGKKFGTIHELKNTDCIIHGALSISGLAMAQSGYFSFGTLNAFWLLVFSFFIIIEALEILRAIQRVKQSGLRDGLFTYHITQWSRNFTFGMFYFFTLTFISRNTSHDLHFHVEIMNIMGWLVICLLVIQIGNWAYNRLKAII